MGGFYLPKKIRVFPAHTQRLQPNIRTYFYAFVLKSRIFAGITFRKVLVSTINRKELRHIFPWKFERLISKFLWVVASENSQANQNMFKVDDRKDARTVFHLMLFEPLWISSENVFASARESVFNEALNI